MSDIQPGDLATWAAVLVALLAAGWGVISSATANRRVSKANELAEAANRIAESALARAERSNTIAQDANALSEEANEHVKRSMAQQQEDHYVKWEMGWDEIDTAIVLTNKGRDVAVRPSLVIVNSARHHIDQLTADVAAGSVWTYKLDDITEKRLERDAYNRKHRDSPAPGVLYIPSAYREKVELDVRWTSVLGVPYDQQETVWIH